MVLEAIFCFDYLKVNDTKDKILTDIFEFRTPKLCKNKWKNNVHLNVEQSSIFYFSAQAKYTHFQKKAAIFSHLKIYIPCTNLNIPQFHPNTHLGSENISQI